MDPFTGSRPPARVPLVPHRTFTLFESPLNPVAVAKKVLELSSALAAPEALTAEESAALEGLLSRWVCFLKLCLTRKH